MGGDTANNPRASGVILHFAYGSNMSRLIMRKHAPDAEPVGVATLANYRFLITADGYASIEPKRGETVHGVVWRLTPHDRMTLDAWENIAAGLYRAATLPVRQAGRRRMALTYLGRSSQTGLAKAGYMQVVIAAALEWQLPQAYISSLRHWLPGRRGGVGRRKLGGFEWT
jgi:cation transport regulator ChaC